MVGDWTWRAATADKAIRFPDLVNTAWARKDVTIMPLFKVGSFEQVSVSLPATARTVKPKYRAKVRLPRKLPLHALPDLSFDIEIPEVELVTSNERWGLYLKSLSLHESFEGFIVNAFNPVNEIYYTSIAWDYSGEAPYVYPLRGVDISTFAVPMKAQTARQFVGDGVSLWPAREVVGALNVVILVYEGDQDTRDLGKRLVDIHEAVQGSELTKLVTAISPTNPQLATGVAIGTAVNELLGVIGKVMKKNGDDYVDLFEGSYGTHKTQEARVEKYDQEAASIELDFTVS